VHSTFKSSSLESIVPYIFHSLLASVTVHLQCSAQVGIVSSSTLTLMSLKVRENTSSGVTEDSTRPIVSLSSI